MSDRLNNLQPYAAQDVEIPARRFNRARLAALRLGVPITMHISELKHMGLLIESDAWICFDEVLNEYPIVAWTNFQAHERGALHEPIRCRLLFYHEHAQRIVETVLSAMDRMLDERLKGIEAEK